MSLASHHQHLRKRKKDKVHPYPHKDPKYQLLDRTIAFVSFVSPFSALPQIYNIWFMKDVQGVSLITWSLLLILGIPLFLYAIVHKDRNLQIMFGLWCVVYLVAVVGLVMYA
ncbi:hypothetical protein HOK68_01020 [Candidatus Woesearchaeota archaeon]|jgi:hypothetical protein|nr:hypothetical protein [Candidatus Woesearchaeota archaeon]MBT4387689.1 hypothetical protein [Candidatus Woesearchaeota archaeon]MBT4595948.1 hypothetical protein [Candidatus Woesearchaeota archaeon]MBT5741078.1 hypothetical protein [Candidatus Woesearchaeota archaeon]MBT6505342.1 hypothetical protein [Candidatus Woesearchaeota archaeon]